MMKESNYRCFAASSINRNTLSLTFFDWLLRNSSDECTGVSVSEKLGEQCPCCWCTCCPSEKENIVQLANDLEHTHTFICLFIYARTAAEKLFLDGQRVLLINHVQNNVYCRECSSTFQVHKSAH